MNQARLCFAALVSVIILQTVFAMAGEGKSNESPLPRFVSLRANEVNMRAGPGEQYPVVWVYRRIGLPLEVTAEYYHWRRVRDWQSSEGWIHESMLSRKRGIMVIGGVRTIRANADGSSPPVVRVETTVIGKLLKCPHDTTWCRVEIGGYEGWLRRSEFWGVHGDETVE